LKSRPEAVGVVGRKEKKNIRKGDDKIGKNWQGTKPEET